MSDQASQQDAIRVVRLFNTLEGWYHYSHGYYAPIDVVLQSDMFTLLKSSSLAEERGISATFFKRLTPTKLEVLQGWRFKLNVSSDSQHYTVLIRQQSSGFVFVSDEDAMIFTGVLTTKKMPKVRGKAETLLAKALPAGGYRQCGAKSVPALSFTGNSPRLLPAGDGNRIACGTDDGGSFPCSCGGSCQGIAVPGMCTNCGCASCVWCCSPY